jgi:hypothetical protein
MKKIISETQIIFNGTEDIKTFLEPIKKSIFIVIDPSSIDDYQIIKDLNQPHAQCLFGGDAKENAGTSAPYLIPWSNVSNSVSNKYLEWVKHGEGLILSTSTEISELRRWLKRFLYQDNDPTSYFNMVIGRKFEDKEDYFCYKWQEA